MRRCRWARRCDTSEDDLSFEPLSFDDVREWQGWTAQMHDVIDALRAATSDEEVAELTARLYRVASYARDAESSAIHLMKRYGYSDGVNVPNIGRFRVRWLDDGKKVLEPLP